MGDFLLGDNAPTDTEEGVEEVAVATRRAKVRRSEPQPAIATAAQPVPGGNMERLGPESQALCQLLMGHISQKGAETTKKNRPLARPFGQPDSKAGREDRPVKDGRSGG